MTLPQFISFTGVDGNTDLQTLCSISRNFSLNVRWGVLSSNHRRSAGEQRYPSEYCKDQIAAMARQYPDIVIVAHLCGLQAQRATTMNYFPRHPWHSIQLNGRDFNRFNTRFMRQQEDTKIILQSQDPNAFPTALTNLEYLYDASGGQGREITSFPIPLQSDQLVGYAGGIGLDNITEIINQISTPNYWLCMENKVRTDDWFDLNTCLQILNKVYNRTHDY